MQTPRWPIAPANPESDGASATDANGADASDAGTSSSDSGGDAAATSDGGSAADGTADTGATGDASSDGSDASASFSATYTFSDQTTDNWWSWLSPSGPTVSLAWANVGDSSTVVGALEATIPFSNGGQSAGVGFNPASPVDLNGRLITFHVYLVSGLSSDPNNAGGMQIQAQNGQSNGYASIEAGWTSLGPANAGQWISISMNVDAAAASTSFDETQVTGLSLQVFSGTAVDSGNPFSPAVIYIDDVTIQ